MPDGFTHEPLVFPHSVQSGQPVTVTLHYMYRPLDPGEPAPEVLIGCAPAFAISCQPSPLTLVPATDGTALVTITISRVAPSPPSFCRLMFNALHDHRECAVTVTP